MTMEDNMELEFFYERKAKYHETDQMGIIHHSNYIKWMEEARVEFMSNMGFSYKKMEQLGIISPVLEINCKYKDMVRFDDTVLIYINVLEYNGVKLAISYKMVNKETQQVSAIAESRHCFLNKENKIISLTKLYPEIDLLFKNYIQ